MLNFHTLPVSHSLVCSDLISRGIDLPHVRHVVSYDSPVDITKYVHRVGRTARANRVGDAWSLVEEQEVSSQSFLPFCHPHASPPHLSFSHSFSFSLLHRPDTLRRCTPKQVEDLTSRRRSWLAMKRWRCSKRLMR